MRHESLRTKELDKDEVWDLIIENGIADATELILVTNICGYNMEALNSVIYSRTAYRSIEQYLEEVE